MNKWKSISLILSLLIVLLLVIFVFVYNVSNTNDNTKILEPTEENNDVSINNDLQNDNDKNKNEIFDEIDNDIMDEDDDSSVDNNLIDENTTNNENNSNNDETEELNTQPEELTISIAFLADAPAGMPGECSFTKVVERKIPFTLGVAKASIEELLKGPSDEEKEEQHLRTIIPVGTKLNSIYIKDGIAHVDFNEALNTIGGSCAIAGVYAEIKNTLTQFPTIDDIVLSINGETENILQP